MKLSLILLLLSSTAFASVSSTSFNITMDVPKQIRSEVTAAESVHVASPNGFIDIGKVHLVANVGARLSVSNSAGTPIAISLTGCNLSAPVIDSDCRVIASWNNIETGTYAVKTSVSFTTLE